MCSRNPSLIFLIISASSTSTPASRALVPLASSVQSLCHLCSSSSQPHSFSSASPRLRHLYSGEEETSPIAKLRPQVSLFIGYAVPVGYLLPDRCPMGTGISKNLYPRQLTGTGWILRSGEENVPAIPDGYIPVAIFNERSTPKMIQEPPISPDMCWGSIANSFDQPLRQNLPACKDGLVLLKNGKRFTEPF